MVSIISFGVAAGVHKQDNFTTLLVDLPDIASFIFQKLNKLQPEEYKRDNNNGKEESVKSNFGLSNSFLGAIMIRFFINLEENSCQDENVIAHLTKETN